MVNSFSSLDLTACLGEIDPRVTRVEEVITEDKIEKYMVKFSILKVEDDEDNEDEDDEQVSGYRS